MELIIGGAYQGKLEYVKNKYGVGDEDIFTCESPSFIDTSKRVIYHFENYLRDELTAEGPIFADLSKIDFRDDAIIIADDIFSGVVPMDDDDRLWREYCGRTITRLSKKCEHVTRIFCGLPLVLK